MSESLLKEEKSWGGEKKTYDDIKHGEIMEIMIIERHFPDFTQDLISKKMFNEMKEAQEHGHEYKPDPVGFKDTGIQYDFAVLERGREKKIPFEKMFIEKHGELVEPTTICFGRIVVYPPDKVWETRYDEKKCYMEHKGFQAKLVKGMPRIYEMLPNPYPVTIDFENKIDAENFPEGKENQYANYEECMAKEQVRIEEWKQLVSKYKEMPEKQALQFLNNIFSRLYGLARKFGDSLEFVTPQIGMRFNAFNMPRGQSRLLTPKCFWWNWDLKQYIIASTFETTEPTDEDVELAAKLVALREKGVARRAAERAAKGTTSTRARKPKKESIITEPEEEEDEVPW